jgi:hypothetical protein
LKILKINKFNKKKKRKKFNKKKKKKKFNKKKKKKKFNKKQNLQLKIMVKNVLKKIKKNKT